MTGMPRPLRQWKRSDTTRIAIGQTVEWPREQWSGAKAFWIWIPAGAAVLTVIAAWLFADTITPWLRQVREWVG